MHKEILTTLQVRMHLIRWNPDRFPLLQLHKVHEERRSQHSDISLVLFVHFLQQPRIRPRIPKLIHLLGTLQPLHQGLHLFTDRFRLVLPSLEKATPNVLQGFLRRIRHKCRDSIVVSNRSNQFRHLCDELDNLLERPEPHEPRKPNLILLAAKRDPLRCSRLSNNYSNLRFMIFVDVALWIFFVQLFSEFTVGVSL